MLDEIGEGFLREFNREILAHSDEFYSYRTPADFRLERREIRVFSTRAQPDLKLAKKVQGTYSEFLRFSSPVSSPWEARGATSRSATSRASCRSAA